MNEAVSQLLDKSRESIGAAELLLRDGYTDFSASRAYYAMFYCVEALLLSREMSFSKHSAVIAAFGKHFVKTGLFPPLIHRHLLDAFDLRNMGDYGTLHAINPEKASELLVWARDFYTEAEAFLVSKM